MTEGDKGEGQGIKIVDRRRFTANGEVRHDAPTDEPRRPAPVLSGGPQRPAQPPGGPAARQGAGPREAPRAASGSQAQAGGRGPEFLSFIASLATNVMAALGVLPEAQARGVPVNHQMARDYIEIIAMLQDRTRGNLTQEEDAAMQRLLSELRMQFVEVTRKG